MLRRVGASVFTRRPLPKGSPCPASLLQVASQYLVELLQVTVFTHPQVDTGELYFLYIMFLEYYT